MIRSRFQVICDSLKTDSKMLWEVLYFCHQISEIERNYILVRVLFEMNLYFEDITTYALTAALVFIQF